MKIVTIVGRRPEREDPPVRSREEALAELESVVSRLTSRSDPMLQQGVLNDDLLPERPSGRR